jgi:hypothetical protein
MDREETDSGSAAARAPVIIPPIISEPEQSNCLAVGTLLERCCCAIATLLLRSRAQKPSSNTRATLEKVAWQNVRPAILSFDRVAQQGEPGSFAPV